MSFSEVISGTSKRWPHPGKEFLWVAAGQSFSYVGAVVAVKLLTTLLSPSEYGALALGVSLAGAMNMFAYGPLGQVVLRFYSICREENLMREFFDSLRQVHVNLSYIILVIGLLTTGVVWAVWGIQWGVLVLSAVLFGVVSGLQGSLLSLANAMRHRPLAAVAQGGDVWLRMAFSIVLVTVIARTGLWAMLGYFTASVLVFSWQLIKLPPEVWQSPETSVQASELSRGIQRRFWEYGAPFLSFAGVAVISQYADRWLVQAFWGRHEVGIYAALYQVASAPIALVMAIVNQVVIPVVFSGVGSLTSEESVERGRALLWRTELFLAGVFGCFSVATFIWGEPLVTFLTSKEYGQQSPACWIIMLGLSVFNLGQLSSILGYSLNRTDLYVWPKVLQGAMLLALGGLLVGHQAVLGMAMALLGASSVYFLSIKIIHMRHLTRHVEVV